MFTFRSSPYGSTSHALANQNAFNTFYGGKALFFSTGHHSSFIDAHSLYSHRSTRAHNTILINGMGQKIGTEGYGWIPRHYEGPKISYVAGDASNAYGEIISPIWKERAQKSQLSLSPENGWDKNHLLTYRRHIVILGDAGLVFIYDELEADTLGHWNYLLHTIEKPMIIGQKENEIQVRAINETGMSEAYLFSNDELEVEMTNKFFAPAVNWLKANNEGHFEPYKNHWHFTATTPRQTTCRLATIINTHDRKEHGIVPERISDTEIRVGNWSITLNLSPKGKASFSIENKADDIKLTYDDATTIQEKGITTIIKDERLELEI
ncbi:MAG: heparinase II/III family protein [Parabacteroides sp.]|nr:heparinase II/III family protein [Parabacteroides sp.]